MTPKNGFGEYKKLYEERFKKNDDAHEKIMLALADINKGQIMLHEDLAVFKNEMKNKTSGIARFWGALSGLITALAALIYFIIKG